MSKVMGVGAARRGWVTPGQRPGFFAEAEALPRRESSTATRDIPWVLLSLLVLLSVTFACAETGNSMRYSFGPTTRVEGFMPVKADQNYDAALGYGFEPTHAVRTVARTEGPAVNREFATADTSFLFSVKAAEGNYHVTVWLGDPAGESDTAVKAETRRAMTPLVRTKSGEVTKVDFLVNVRTPRIDDRTSVGISKTREKPPGVLHWDDKLTLEFCGKHPAVSAVQIEHDESAVTVFLAGDSTVTDQANEPWAAWGQLLPQFFTPKVAIANHAESGRTLKSFKGERRWDKILSQLRAGDYVFIQFGHNDMKETGPGIGAFTSFSDSLRQYVADVRAKGGLPVLLTPMHRRQFAGNEIQPTFGDYPEAVRRVAAEQKVPLIDLQAMSKPLYQAFGPEKSKLLFVHFPVNSFPGQDKPLKDDTHFRAFGADQIARCVVQGVRDLKLPLAVDIREGVPPFDPTKPGDPAAYDLPPSAPAAMVLPEGK